MTNQPQPHRNEREYSLNGDIILRRQEVRLAIDSINYIAKGLNFDSTPADKPQIAHTSNASKDIRHNEMVFGSRLMAQINPQPYNNQTPLEAPIETQAQDITLQEARNNVFYSLENPSGEES